MHRKIAPALYSGILAVVLGGASVVVAFAQAGGAVPSLPPSAGEGKAAPAQPDEDLSVSSAGSLSHQLNRSGGVIHPPADIDPGLAQPVPDLGPHSMPVIPPPGTPGGNPDIKPKSGS
jgi:hypothetical protein